ncbi:MAG: MFS transporter [Bacteroidia bacterium]
MNKPRLSSSQIINMSLGFLGIQFGFGLQNANVSRIFQTLGANIDDIPILWIAAPLTGLLVQPIIGYMSDKTWGKWGRRRPYFMVGAILASLALLVMPHSSFLWMAAIMLWVLDASINITMEPFRAFVGDMLPDEQRTDGFAMQSFFIGVGSVLSSALPWVLTQMGVSNEAAAGEIPASVIISFYLGAVVFFGTVAYTVFTTKEYSPEELASFEKGKNELYSVKNTDNEAITPSSIFTKQGLIWAIIGVASSLALWSYNQSLAKPLEKELYVITFGVAAYGFIQLLVGYFVKNGQRNGLVETIDDLYKMPTTMRKLAVVQFFTWFALFAMWIYTTAAVTKHLYHATDANSPAYNEGANWVGILFSVYNGVAALAAFALPILAKRTSRAMTHLISLVAGGLGLISIFFFNSPNLLILSMVGVGIAWASIVSMPYAILTKVLPSEKMGVYMGIFNFFIVIPQMLAATLLGFCTNKLFGGDPIYTLVLGGVSMIVAGLLCLIIQEDNTQS